MAFINKMKAKMERRSEKSGVHKQDESQNGREKRKKVAFINKMKAKTERRSEKNGVHKQDESQNGKEK
ncbi:hypothetical protein C2I17_16225 [Niallia circulans]|uniref:hypothetical protein n=1 Tax=Niallia circulans TaxID=1397 RepID=UPI00201E6EEB|nr:hypothetical protein [Niallia circulans]UQZ75970.1 hypothetical protein C2I17_16225 [Niallia circulans]